MSKRQDRARAESGIIFRDGEYQDKATYYLAHPTPETVRARQAEVDAALAAEFVAVRDYYCTKCTRVHKYGSKIHDTHESYAEVIVFTEAE